MFPFLAIFDLPDKAWIDSVFLTYPSLASGIHSDCPYIVRC